MIDLGQVGHTEAFQDMQCLTAMFRVMKDDVNDRSAKRHVRVDVLGLLLAVVLAFFARPLALAPLLIPLRMRVGERLFIAWGGLKGAVPILLASFAILAEVDDARRMYEIVFVVVLLSVVVQGSTLPLAARRLGVQMRPVR